MALVKGLKGFFLRNETPVITTPVECQANGSLSECDSVAKIKAYQQEIKELKNMDLEDIVCKYLAPDQIHNKSYFYRDESLNYIIRNLLSRNECLEERLRMLGKKLDEYKHQYERLSELRKLLEQEKEILGIE